MWLPLEKEAEERQLFCWVRGGEKHTWKRDKDLSSSSLGSFPFLKSGSSWLLPTSITAGCVLPHPTGEQSAGISSSSSRAVGAPNLEPNTERPTRCCNFVIEVSRGVFIEERKEKNEGNDGIVMRCFFSISQHQQCLKKGCEENHAGKGRGGAGGKHNQHKIG